MNNEPVAWMSNEYSVCSKEAYQTLSENARSWYPIPLYTHPANPYQSITDTKIETTVVSYTHPVKDREKDRLRFSDEAFNRWLDESISDSGHTVYDLVENVCEAWHGWENSQYYTHPAELTDEEIDFIFFDLPSGHSIQEFARAILRKASEK